MITVLTLEIRYEQDVVLTRQQARLVAEQLGFDAQDQVRLATAVSEMARNAFQYAGGGRVDFLVDLDVPQAFLIQVSDRGPGITHLDQILAGRYTSITGMGQGMIGTQRLMDHFQVESVPGQGTTVLMGKTLPALTLGKNRLSSQLTLEQVTQIQQRLAERSPQNPYEEIQRQNQELLRALAELRQREEELTQLNRELEDTNRGVVALYAELDEKADSLQKANELKTRFFSNMSHEFRTPLNSIVSLSRILLSRMDGDLAPEQEKQVIFIQKAAEGLSELINDLLDLAKMEAGKIVIHPSRFEVSDLFGTLRGMLRPLLAHNSSIALYFDEPVGIAPLLTDEGKVAQILRNFISNALKFTEQGEVRVSAVASTDDMIIITVADTGIGISPADQERIFEDFVQIDSPLQKRLKGTGLGLPLSRKLAELLGGQVAVSSEPGQGATFSVTLPIVYPGLTETTTIPTHWSLDPTRKPLLVIEDHAETLLVYQKYLECSAYQMIAAETLDDARQILQHLTPTAIILDILLRDQPAWSFLSDLKDQDATKSVPVLVITVIDNEKRALALGADGFLIKPVDRWSLFTKLNRLIKQNYAQTLLLIDDDSATRYILKQLLSSTPLTIVEAADGREGLRLAKTEQPDAIVLDLNMPELNGYALLEQLKQDATTQTIPIIVHTSASLDRDKHTQLMEHSVAVLSKATMSQSEAIAQLQQALMQAGIVLDSEGETHG